MTRRLSSKMLGVGAGIAGASTALVVAALVLAATSGPPGPSESLASSTPETMGNHPQTSADIAPRAPADSNDGPLVEPDPNFMEELIRARLSTSGWKTDFSRHTVPFDEILSGGPSRDGIPPLDNPRFITRKMPVDGSGTRSR